jgi:hypothetical protein
LRVEAWDCDCQKLNHDHNQKLANQEARKCRDDTWRKDRKGSTKEHRDRIRPGTDQKNPRWLHETKRVGSNRMGRDAP